MNRLFNLKASVVLFAIIFCQTALRAQSVSQDTSHVQAKNSDTTLTKKKSNSILVKSDTALIVKAGATIVQKADTTLVINADPELIRKFNEIVAAKQQSDQKKADSAAASKQSTFTQLKTNPPPVTKSDSVASSSASVPVSVPAVNPGAATTTVAGAATSVVTGAAKTDASIPAQTNGTNTNSTGNNNQQPSNNAGSTSTGNTTPANKPDSTAAAQPVSNNAVQQTTNSTVQTNKADSTSAKKADANQQAAASSTPAVKTDSALTTKVDTTIKKSDTTKMKKDTALMVTDTAGHVDKAKAIYLEVGGAGLAISGNYDSRFHDERDGWGYRVGAGFFSSGGNTVFTIPFQINYLTGEHSSHMELGAGVTFLNSTGTNMGTSKWEFDKVTGFIATATIGFRYQPEHKGLNFRIAFVPILYDEGIIPAGGVSIGYTFK